MSNKVDNPMHQQLKQQALSYFQSSFEHFYDHAIAVDKFSCVTWISDSYAQFLGLKHDPVGAPITDILPNSFMPTVVSTGEPVLLDMLNINDDWVVISAFPLKNDQQQVIGAFGYVAVDQMQRIKPLLHHYNRLAEHLQKTREELRQNRRARYTLSQCIGSSQAMRKVKQQISQAARYDMAVLLEGETGTGKEMFAHALHNLSARCDGPFISVNVAAIPESLLEAEFFGVSPGAYTGAQKGGRDGKLGLAQNGTLFLDEIGDMPLELQAKLLRVLEEKEYEKLGSNILQEANIRIIAASSRNLEKMVADKQFRADLYYRLNTVPVTLPPLRQRLEDLPALTERLLEEIAISHQQTPKDMEPAAIQVLAQHGWPGNIRELKNLLERACIACSNNSISITTLCQLLDLDINPNTFIAAQEPIQAQATPPSGSLRAILEQAERDAIIAALRACNYNKAAAARKLSISRASLYNKLQQLDIKYS